MTLVSDIIQRGYRESNLIGVGMQPTTAEAAEALPLLQEIIASVYGNQVGENFQPLLIGNNNIEAPVGFPAWLPVATWWAPLNVRLVCNLPGEQTINLSPFPQDGSRMAVIDASGNFSTNPLTLVGNGHSIEGAHSLVMNTDGLAKEWLFRADLDNWQLVTPLALTDAMPFPQEYDSFFAILLASRLNPRSGKALSIESQGALKAYREEIRARYHQVVPTISAPGVLRMSRQSVGGNGRWWGRRGSRTEFLSGRPW